MTARILMTEDDHRLATMVSSYLSQNGFTVQSCEPQEKHWRNCRLPAVPRRSTWCCWT